MAILEILDVPVSWVLVQFYSFFSMFMDPYSGWTWAASIVGLVILMRIILIPLFVKQIKAQRGLQIIQPQMKEIQKKYAGDRERQSQEMMSSTGRPGRIHWRRAYRSFCLIFFGLFRVLQYGIAQEQPIGVFGWTQYQDLVSIAHDATIFDVPLWATFWLANEVEAETGTSALTVRILAAILIVAMSSTTFLTQRQLIVKNTAPDNPMVQRNLLYVFPLVFAIGGVNFPIGVLIYWFTTNVVDGPAVLCDQEQPSTRHSAFEARARKKEKAAKKAARKVTDKVDALEEESELRHPVGKTATEEDVAQYAQEEEVATATLRGGRALGGVERGCRGRNHRRRGGGVCCGRRPVTDGEPGERRRSRGRLPRGPTRHHRRRRGYRYRYGRRTDTGVRDRSQRGRPRPACGAGR